MGEHFKLDERHRGLETTMPLHPCTFKFIFHWKWRPHWLLKAYEIDTNNMKCTFPTRAPTRGDPTLPIFNQLALGLALGPQDFSDTHMLVFWGSRPTQTLRASCFALQWTIGYSKEGVLLRNVSPSLVLCDHFPGGGILELQTGSSWEWPFIVCLFWE